MPPEVAISPRPEIGSVPPSVHGARNYAELAARHTDWHYC